MAPQVAVNNEPALFRCADCGEIAEVVFEDGLGPCCHKPVPESEEDIERFLIEALDVAALGASAYERGYQASSYEEAGVLTRDRGVVLRVGGREFSITIQRRR